MDFLPGGRPRPRFGGDNCSEITFRGRPRGRFRGATTLTFALTTLPESAFAFALGGRPRFLGFRAAGLRSFFGRPGVFDFFAKTSCG